MFVQRRYFLQLTTKVFTASDKSLRLPPTGTGRSYLACVLAHKACLEGFRARYHRLPRLLEELSVARADTDT